MKYVAFADQFIAKGFAHAEALASGQTSKLYLDEVKVKKIKDYKGLLFPGNMKVRKDGDGGAIIVITDDAAPVSRIKDKVKDTFDEAKADKVEKPKAKIKKKQ